MNQIQAPTAADYTPREVGLEATSGAMDQIEPALTEDELGDLLRVPLRVLARMRRKGEGPAYVVCGGFIRYPAGCVRRFLARADSGSIGTKE